jgi:TFIIB zinc-binding
MAYAQPFPLAAPPTKTVQPSFGPDLAVRLICPECRDPNPNIVEEFGSGDLVCGNCGLVLGDRIVDTRSEWRVSPPFDFIFGANPVTSSFRRLLTTKETILLVSVLRQTL